MIPHGGRPSMYIVLPAIFQVRGEQSDHQMLELMSQSELGCGFAVAAFVVITYDWALTLGREVELVWRQRWSLMTVMYLSVRYLGILSAALSMVYNVPTISLTDTSTNGYWLPCYTAKDVSWMIYTIWDWTGAVVFSMLWVIIITRLHAMYQRDRKILIFLVVTFLAINAFAGVTAVMSTMHTSGEELILSGTYMCRISYTGDALVLDFVTWILYIVWEVLTLCLAVWIAVKHFRELRLHGAGEIIGDCLTVLMKTHLLYFASFVAVSCVNLIIMFSPTSSTNRYLLEDQTLYGLLEILAVVMFVLGPRLILGIREYNAKLVADSDAATGMTSIAFQERVHISTGSSV
ncbi:uncharacterized protein F5147DRAFT_774310 [Suillus discolor]|uniref:DUF6533 domain-containing protein n=1 Tax=Suillus discolor TaxID=1912936 RepID=A0A9P7F5C0_9AGAM|nr:uncharacterized protein F5147DRAFT_774310 [Suillus discolor]KAG2107481.1 hypothetical protein F5147DRAFT_774310 [Suillus discolor]